MKVGLYLSSEMYQKIKEKATQSGLSVNAYLRVALNEYWRSRGE